LGNGGSSLKVKAEFSEGLGLTRAESSGGLLPPRAVTAARRHRSGRLQPPDTRPRLQGILRPSAAGQDPLAPRRLGAARKRSWPVALIYRITRVCVTLRGQDRAMRQRQISEGFLHRMKRSFGRSSLTGTVVYAVLSRSR
jgi:hypothetical protein